MGAPNGGEGNVIIARGFRNGLRWKNSFFISESPIPCFKIRGLDSMSFQVPFHLNLLQILQGAGWAYWQRLLWDTEKTGFTGKGDFSYHHAGWKRDKLCHGWGTLLSLRVIQQRKHGSGAGVFSFHLKKHSEENPLSLTMADFDIEIGKSGPLPWTPQCFN